jgi:hypothetical protein
MKLEVAGRLPVSDKTPEFNGDLVIVFAPEAELRYASTIIAIEENTAWANNSRISIYPHAIVLFVGQHRVFSWRIDEVLSIHVGTRLAWANAYQHTRENAHAVQA